jgi:hypothetical protein
VGGQPARAVEGALGLLAAGQRHLEGALELDVLGLEPGQGVDPHRRHRLIVAGAAGVEVTVLLDQGEGVAGPVGALGLDHVDVGEQQQRPGLGIGPRQHGDQAALLGMVGG